MKMSSEEVVELISGMFSKRGMASTKVFVPDEMFYDSWYNVVDNRDKMDKVAGYGLNKDGLVVDDRAEIEISLKLVSVGDYATASLYSSFGDFPCALLFYFFDKTLGTQNILLVREGALKDGRA